MLINRTYSKKPVKERNFFISRLITGVVSLLISVSALMAQTTVQIGNGANSIGCFLPVYRPSSSVATTNVRGDILFTQTELAAAGIPPGANIISIEFDKQTTASFTVPVSYSMYMANTSNAALTTGTPWSTILSTHTLVYSSNSFNLPAAVGWVAWPINPSFLYTGGSLEIAVDQVVGGSGGSTGTISWKSVPNSSSTMSPFSIGAFTSTGVPPDLLDVVANDSRRTRPNIKITFMPPAPCVATAQLTVGNITLTSADIKWLAATGATGYEYAVTNSPTPPLSGISTIDTFYDATGLTAATLYYVHVRTKCTNSNFSTWVTTPFSTLTPVCNAPSVPVVSTIGGTVATIAWHPVAGNAGYEYELSNDAAPPTSGTWINDTSVNATGLAVSAQYYFHVRTKCASDFSSWKTVSFSTTCPAPLTATIQVTGLSASVNWQPVNGISSYQYAVTTSQLPPASGTGTSSTSLSLAGLSGATTYYLHVRADCGAGFSSWTVTLFNTACPPPSPVINSININTGTAKIHWGRVSGATSYEYAVLNHASPPLGSFTTITDTSLNLNGLVPGNKYYLHIRSHCGDKGISPWSTLGFYSSGVGVYPNPVTDRMTITLNGLDNSGGTIRIFDAQGKEVKRIKMTGNSIDISTGNFAKGMYLIKYESYEGFVKKIIKL